MKSTFLTGYQKSKCSSKLVAQSTTISKSNYRTEDRETDKTDRQNMLCFAEHAEP